MKSYINLYQEQYRPQFIWITLSHLTTICILISLVAIGISAYLANETALYADQIKTRQNTLNQQQVVLNEMAEALTQRSEDPQLIANLAALQSNIRGKEALLKRIDSLGTLQSNSFSKMLTALANIDTNELWLTRIQVVDSDVSMQGLISSPEALPLWIRSLSSTDYFSEQNFSQAAISREDNMLMFTLASQLEGADNAN